MPRKTRCARRAGHVALPDRKNLLAPCRRCSAASALPAQHGAAAARSGTAFADNPRFSVQAAPAVMPSACPRSPVPRRPARAPRSCRTPARSSSPPSCCSWSSRSSPSRSCRGSADRRRCGRPAWCSSRRRCSAGYAYADLTQRLGPEAPDLAAPGACSRSRSLRCRSSRPTRWKPRGDEEPIAAHPAAARAPPSACRTSCCRPPRRCCRPGSGGASTHAVPYRLFALSNFASLLALLGFPGAVRAVALAAAARLGLVHRSTRPSRCCARRRRW